MTSRTQILVVTFPPACCLHVARGHASFLHATHANSRGYTSSLLPTQHKRSRFLLACHPTWHIRREHRHRVNLTYQVHYAVIFVRPRSGLLPLYWQMLKRSSSHYSTVNQGVDANLRFLSIPDRDIWSLSVSAMQVPEYQQSLVRLCKTLMWEVVIDPTLPRWAEYDTRSTFKRFDFRVFIILDSLLYQV